MLRPSAAALMLCFALALPANADTRPSDCRGIPWCGCWLRHQFGLTDKRLNQARQWAKLRPRVAGPCIGCVAVFAHSHVGIMTGYGRKPGMAIIKSGNDGGRVRERERSIRNVIAWVK